jgi:cobalt/nickel transport system permease protein
LIDGLDKYAHLGSPLHHWDPRCKLVGLIILMFAFSFVQDLQLLPAMLAVTSGLYAVSRMPLAFLLTRLRTPGIFVVVMAILLPFLSGTTVIAQIGPLSLRQEGTLAMSLIVAKFTLILTISLVLFGTAPFLTTIKALRALGLAPILADMILLTYRYLYEVGNDFNTMERAMGLRGFRARRLSNRVLDVLASLAGTMLVRTYEQSERVYKAMILRGYGHSPRPRDQFQAHPRDWVGLACVCLVAAGFVAMEIWLRGSGG